MTGKVYVTAAAAGFVVGAAELGGAGLAGAGLGATGAEADSDGITKIGVAGPDAPGDAGDPQPGNASTSPNITTKVPRRTY